MPSGRTRKARPSKTTRTRAQNKVLAPAQRVVRAAQALRQGKAVIFEEAGRTNTIVLAVETASDKLLARLKPPVLQVLTHARARTLKIRLYTPGVVAVIARRPLNSAHLRAVADPTIDLAEPMKGPFETVRDGLPASYPAAIKLAKLAGLLPSVVVARAQKKETDKTAMLTAAEVQSYDAEAVRSLAIVTRARVPLEDAENTELVAFRGNDGGPEHYAIVVNAPRRDRPVLTRLHSECFTGDFLGSLKCDCGNQLRGAIRAIKEAGGGVLLYLAQEGRGIGLINKLRAYRLQDQGFDTIDANERLGFEADERLYGVAARMLDLLGYKSVRLLTNNPDKVESLKAKGITVTERVPHSFPENVHNRGYLMTKAAKAGHLI